jgi:alkanesulfonate monooxygenase SsuD/methylene tetrahydromethanopterin reductase-like flavin-dependent oxidoreductase (luciferase family)
MDVGISILFQNPGREQPDSAVYKDELSLALKAEDLGFDSLWTVEHHFTDYCMCPEPLQFLTYMAGRTSTIRLGTGVIVLPWHDPVRVVEQVSMADAMCDGRLIVGVGRGLGRIEFEGYRVPMEQARERFDEAAEILIDGLRTGRVKYDGKIFQVPEREVRPSPEHSFDGRIYSAATSRESVESSARLGLPLLVVAQKPFEMVRDDVAAHAEIYKETHGVDSPPASCAIFVYCHEDEEKAAQVASEYIGRYYDSTLAHYEMTGSHFKGTKGYESYDRVASAINRQGVDAARDQFINLHAFGTPKQIVEKIAWIQSVIGCEAVIGFFKYSGMSHEMASASMDLFARDVIPKLKKLPSLASTRAPLDHLDVASSEGTR